ncbi:hypothetical protein BH10ACT5_BH10ACT5_09030 [soil metagenome]
MTAPEQHDDDPQHDAESLVSAPQTAAESARTKEFASLFGAPHDEIAPRSEAEEAARRDSLAALFARPANAPAAAAQPDFTWDPEAVVGPEKADAAPVGTAGVGVETAEPSAVDLPAAGISVKTAGAAAESAAATGFAGVDAADAAPVGAAAVIAKTAGAAPADAAATGFAGVDAADAAPVGAAGVRAAGVRATGARAAVAGPGADVPESEPDLHETDFLAWLGFTDDAASGTVAEADGAASASRVSTARASWLDIIGGGSRTKTAMPAAVAARAMAEPTAVLGATSNAAPAGSFPSAERRGIRGWSSRVRWSVAVAIVLLIGLVVGSVAIAQTIAADNLAAQELAAAVADLEAAEESAADPQPVLDEAATQYEDTVAIAQATADSAAPPLAAVAGMAAQPVLDASNAALAALVAQLAAAPPADLPELYERDDIDVGDIEAVKAATKTANDHVGLITTATREVRAAQAALQEKLDALRAAQMTLGASLPETAVLIVGENGRALQTFRDAVIAASVAVPTAQNAGGSGDAEMLAYAAAVTALRDDQTRAVTDVTPVTPPATVAPPAPDPAPAPVPEPVPPAPEDSSTPTPTPSPSP